MRTILSCLLFCVMTVSAMSAEAEDKALATLRALTVPEEVTLGDIGGAQMRTKQKVEEWALEAAALLVSAEPPDGDFLELLWWRTPHKSVRLLIVAAFKCRGEEAEARSTYPGFDSNRFAKPEREERLRELRYVGDNRTEFTRLMVDLTKHPRSATLHARYTAALKESETRDREKAAGKERRKAGK